MEQRSTNRSKRPLLPKHVCSIPARLEMQNSAKDLAMFNLAIGSKLRASDLMHLRITDVCSDQNVRDRGVIVQKKTGRPVQFEVTRETRLALEAWIAASGNGDGGYMPRESIKRPATFALCNCFWDIPRSKARLDGAQGRTAHRQSNQSLRCRCGKIKTQDILRCLVLIATHEDIRFGGRVLHYLTKNRRHRRYVTPDGILVVIRRQHRPRNRCSRPPCFSLESAWITPLVSSPTFAQVQ